MVNSLWFVVEHQLEDCLQIVDIWLNNKWQSKQVKLFQCNKSKWRLRVLNWQWIHTYRSASSTWDHPRPLHNSHNKPDHQQPPIIRRCILVQPPVRRKVCLVDERPWVPLDWEDFTHKDRIPDQVLQCMCIQMRIVRAEVVPAVTGWFYNIFVFK